MMIPVQIVGYVIATCLAGMRLRSLYVLAQQAIVFVWNNK